jgi:NAD(P)H-dependent FMN reductase
MKSFLDSFPFPNPLKGTIAAMVGISAGTNGGANGMSHLADVLNYLGVSVLPQRLRLYSIIENWADGEIVQPMLRSIMAEQQAALAASVHATIQHAGTPLVLAGNRS